MILTTMASQRPGTFAPLSIQELIVVDYTSMPAVCMFNPARGHAFLLLVLDVTARSITQSFGYGARGLEGGTGLTRHYHQGSLAEFEAGLRVTPRSL